MKRFLLSPIIMFFCILGLFSNAYSQDAQIYNKNGISFSFPAGSKVEEGLQPGEYDQVNCTTPTGGFFSITVYRKKIDPASEIEIFKKTFETEYTKTGATNIKFSDSQFPGGWRMTFTMNNVNFVCMANHSEFGGPHPKQVIILQQYPVFGEETSAPDDLTKSVQSIRIR